nr:MAG: hypothetical protein 3 [Leviviridae sp.]
MKMRVKTVKRLSTPLVVQPRKVTKIIHHLLMKSGQHGPNKGTFSPYSQDLPPTQGVSGHSFAIDYLAAEVFSKYDDEKSSTSKDQVAWQRFQSAEDICHTTNKRFKDLVDSKVFFKSSSVRSILYTASRKITGLLGSFCWDEASMYFGHGPGGTTRLPRSRGHKVYKYSGRPETTIGNAALGSAAIMQKAPLWTEGLEFRENSGYCDIVPGNRIITVPKNYKTNRVIAIEPCMNVYVQKGIGGVIRRRLRRVGVDLTDQSKNQRLARVGSLSGLLATVDLSMASDTLSIELVRHLLPPDWFSAMEQCRSLKGLLPTGDTIVYSKFSSMGNGFTFELESLIFWALSLTVVEHLKLTDHRIAIYGDDIIVPVAAVPLLKSTLEFCGFNYNLKKTHVDGRFRESCGKHYLNGCDVTPFFIRREVKSLSDLFLLHNNLRRWAIRTDQDLDTRLNVYEAMVLLRKIAPCSWRRPRIPDGMGDGAFIGSFDECTPTLSNELRNRGFEGFSVKLLTSISETVEVDSIGRLIFSLNNLEIPSPVFPFQGLESKAVGVTTRPRTREVMTLVPQFPMQDKICMFPY